MSDSLLPAAKLANLLGTIDLEQVLPAAGPVISHEDLVPDRMEIRQVAGIGAGGRFELSPGSEYDFGPARQSTGQLDDGEPDVVGFTLSLDDDLRATVSPGGTPLTIERRPVLRPTEVGDRVINAGSARFVVARPRPPQRRDGSNQSQWSSLEPWVLSLLPGELRDEAEAASLFEQRRRWHAGPDDLTHRVEVGGQLLWDRGPYHPLFGTAVVAMTDVPVVDREVKVSVAAPVSIDVLASPTMLAGPRDLQLAVARHLILSLATTISPNDLQLELRSGCSDLQFLNDLPHAGRPGHGQTGTTWVIDGDSGTIGERHGPRRLVVIDRPQGHNRRLPPGFHGGRTSFLVLTGETDVLTADADVLSLQNEESINVLAGKTTRERAGDGPGVAEIREATPVGFADSMAEDVAQQLRCAYEGV